MNAKGFVARPRWIMEICPYCHRKLGLLGRFMRRTRRLCRCGKCGRKIDERFVVW